MLQRYEQLLAEHVVIAVFLTMLVGAGGNAGNQSAIKIIEKIVLGEITVSIGSFLSEMHREVIVGMFLCVFVAIGGFVRAYITHGRARGGFLNVLALDVLFSGDCVFINTHRGDVAVFVGKDWRRSCACRYGGASSHGHYWGYCHRDDMFDDVTVGVQEDQNAGVCGSLGEGFSGVLSGK